MVQCSPSPELPRVNGAPCEIPENTDGPGTSSDSEDEQLVSHEGYELLPQQLEEEEVTDNETPTTTSDDQHPSSCQNDASASSALFEENNLVRAEREERVQLWSGPGGRDTEPLDETRTQQVLQAMAGFSLPSSAVPEWASAIPEDQWRATLDERLQAFKGTVLPRQ